MNNALPNRALPNHALPNHALPHLLPTLHRWQAAILDPRTVDLVGRPDYVTAYRDSGLVVHPAGPDAQERVRSAIREVLARRDWIAEPGPGAVRMRPGPASTAPVHPWQVVAALQQHPDPEIAAGVGLDHLLTMAEQVGGNPFAIGHGRVGLDGYGSPSAGDRGPVSLVLRTPPAPPGRAPRVVVLDTGLGDHPWFRDGRSATTITLADGTKVGPQIDPDSITRVDSDRQPATANALLGTLATHTGHGTFIAGLLRQACPAAEIVALAVMGSDGIVAESTLTDALATVLAKQRSEPGWADALVLSLGYYAETRADLAYNTALKRVLLDLATLGVAVFCAAGNDASSRPSYPAAFAIDPAFAAPDVVPLVSVAALGPDGNLAPFSNDGPWVVAAAPGVNLVSTAPDSTDGSARAAQRTTGRFGTRSTVDPDSLASGFASWSGTSFAAPVLAGQYLRALAAAGFPPIPERRSLIPLRRRTAEASTTST